MAVKSMAQRVNFLINFSTLTESQYDVGIEQTYHHGYA